MKIKIKKILWRDRTDKMTSDKKSKQKVKRKIKKTVKEKEKEEGGRQEFHRGGKDDPRWSRRRRRCNDLPPSHWSSGWQEAGGMLTVSASGHASRPQFPLSDPLNHKALCCSLWQTDSHLYALFTAFWIDSMWPISCVCYVKEPLNPCPVKSTLFVNRTEYREGFNLYIN